MPKMKTNRGAAKRFKLKKNLIKRGSAFKSHILTKKSPKRKANLNAPHYVHSSNVKQVKQLFCLM
ncbi:MAG: 50S ribosomal protein L35 [Helicobacteraceae bacterium]|nr:50S ribosomal protein L35 [Helicobacteraceae bacterium]